MSSAPLDVSLLQQALRPMVQRLHLNSGQEAPRIVALIAAREKEGTSTLALHYAKLLNTELGKKLLLLTTSTSQPAGLVDAAASDTPVEHSFQQLQPGLYSTPWKGSRTNPLLTERVLQNPEFWQELLQQIDNIIIDAPALQQGFEGVLLASKADATIIVCEAESTPAPVAEKLRDTLTAAGARVAGIALNKRRFYVPDTIYERL